MYSLEHGLRENKTFGFLAKPLGFLFAVFCMVASFGIGNMSQVNSISGSMNSSFGVAPFVTGIVLAVVSGLVILGGIKRIGQVCEKLVPFMSLLYIVCTITILVKNGSALPHAFQGIFLNAFKWRAVGGAAAGVLIKNACTMGFKRGVFSNEAGLGSSVMAHTNSETKEPVKQAMWGIFEVFMDTIVICTLTALVILSTVLRDCSVLTIDEMKAAATTTPVNAYYTQTAADKETSLYIINNDPVDVDGSELPSFGNVYSYYLDKEGNFVMEQVNGAALMNICFENALGPWAGKILSIAIILFAFSTVIGWSCYGLSATEYLFKNKAASLIYRIIYVAVTVVGATMKLDLVWDISDTLNGLMSIPNLIGLLIMAPTVVKLTDNYLRRTVKKEEVTPLLSYFE